ncbi:MAG: GNAT family N-acetyltransferase [Gaiellaceae bacterium]
MNVRRATSADRDAIAAVVRAVYEEYGFTWDESGYHADLADVDSAYDAFWVADDGGGVVGTAGLDLSDTRIGSLRDCDCSLERLYVLARARGRGAGSALMRAVVAEASATGRSSLAIWSDKRFADAHRLYERLGARVVAERVHDDPDRSHEWGLVLHL